MRRAATSLDNSPRYIRQGKLGEYLLIALVAVAGVGLPVGVYFRLRDVDADTMVARKMTDFQINPPASLPVAEPASPSVKAPYKISEAFILQKSEELPEPKESLVPAAPVAGARSFERVRPSTEEQLARELLNVPEVALDQKPGTSLALHKAAQAVNNPAVDLAPALMAQRPDLGGLPIRRGTDCHLPKEPAETLQYLSGLLRGHLQAASQPVGSSKMASPDANLLRERLLNATEKEKWLRPEAIPVLTQMLMAGARPIRQLLVELLTEITGRQASQALLERSLYELDPDVRQLAAKALEKRPVAEFQDLLIPAFQHPWPPVADHAAELIAYLQLNDLKPKLAPLLEMKNPLLAVKSTDAGQSQYVVTELVRVSHLANCMMCHASSFNSADILRAMVPVPGRPGPQDATSAAPYGGTQGPFIRADVTYLKQDFSAEQPVARSGPSPAQQRFDFLLRRRTLSDLERTARLVASKSSSSNSFRQKEALLFALKAIAGKQPEKETGAQPITSDPGRASGTANMVSEIVSTRWPSKNPCLKSSRKIRMTTPCKPWRRLCLKCLKACGKKAAISCPNASHACPWPTCAGS